MSDWWSSREPREQVLILIAAALSIVVIGLYGVVRPLANMREAASIRLQTARQDFALVDAGLQSARTTAAVTTGPAASADAFRAEVTQMARERGISVSRLQTGADGTVIVTMEAADPQQVFQWAASLSTRPGGTVRSATFNGREAGLVQAVVELQAIEP